MATQIEKLDKSQVKFTIRISPEQFEDGIKFAYNTQKNKISLPGFRKGKVPRYILEKQFGVEMFYDDALNFALKTAYPETIRELDLDIVSEPSFDLKDASKENGAEIEVTLTVKPEAVLGEYKGIEYNKPSVEVSDDEINAVLTKAQEKNARVASVTDAPIQENDIVTIDFEGFVDGVAFEGGKGEDYDLVIGSHSFIDTFEDQLIGHEVGDDLTVCVRFPENYQATELQGKPAEFKVEIKDIKKKELPEIDDEFAQDVSEFDTLEEYKNSIREELIKEKEHRAEHEIEEQLLQTVSDNASVEVPDVMVESQIDQMLQEYEYRLRSQGMNLEMFLQYTGNTIDTIRENYREPAEKSVRARLVLEAIAAAEGFTATEEEISAEVSAISKQYGLPEDKADMFFRDEDKKGLTIDIAVRKAVNLIRETAVETVSTPVM